MRNLDINKIAWYNLISVKIAQNTLYKERLFQKMKKERYHHGDLRRSLIEAGLELINLYGEEKLSLRKAAEKCGVSNAAPYAHFKNKDEFTAAIQEHVIERFTEALESTVSLYGDSDRLMVMLGKAYVMFFYENPLYFDFLFSRKNIKIRLSLNISSENENPPLDILKKCAAKAFEKTDLSLKEKEDKIIAMWALVHGLASIASMPNAELDGRWEDRAEDIICAL